MPRSALLGLARGWPRSGTVAPVARWVWVAASAGGEMVAAGVVVAVVLPSLGGDFWPLCVPPDGVVVDPSWDVLPLRGLPGGAA